MHRWVRDGTNEAGSANGTDGDLIMFGPPFIITDAEIEQLVTITAEAIASAL